MTDDAIGPPYYTARFASMGGTLETARRTQLFTWFHLVEQERHPAPPGELVRFRPSGDSFQNRCHLDVLATARGELVQLGLIVTREFIDGPEHFFARDLVKSFLLGVLPDACRSVQQEFMQQITTPGSLVGRRPTAGLDVFLGRRREWSAMTGWSRIELRNETVAAVATLVVRVAPNPTAPNAKLVSGDDHMERP